MKIDIMFDVIYYGLDKVARLNEKAPVAVLDEFKSLIKGITAAPELRDQAIRRLLDQLFNDMNKANVANMLTVEEVKEFLDGLEEKLIKEIGDDA